MHPDVRRALRIALLSPFTNTQNAYIELQKRLLGEAGYAVRPLSVASLLSGNVAQLFSRHNIVCLHWLETRPFRRRRDGSLTFSFTGSALFVLYLALLSIARARVVYFVHNHAAHDSQGVTRWLSRRLIRVLARVADVRVVHDPLSCEPYGASYLPHPLYWDLPDSDTQPIDPAPDMPGIQPRFMALGSIRRYKALDELLEVWPVGVPLLIAGAGDPAYVGQLREIVERRALAPLVEIDDRFMSPAQFAQRLQQCAGLLLPHAPESMLVSGAFFEAFGRVPYLLVRSQPFFRWVSERADSILLFADAQSLPALVSQVMQQPAHRAPARAAGCAVELFGWRQCTQRYRELLAPRAS